MSARISPKLQLLLDRATPEELAQVETFLEGKDPGGVLGILKGIYREIGRVRSDLVELSCAVAGNAVEMSPGGLPRYLLRKGLQGWQLVFDGKESVLWDEKAVRYVSVLLLDPPMEPIHGRELANRAFGDAVIEEQRNLGLDDAETARAMAASQAKCLGIIDDEGASELEREEARVELAEIQEWARKNLRGTEANEQRQVRAIRQSIRRLLERLRTARNAQGERDEVLQAFGEHLERYLWRPSSTGLNRRSSRLRAGIAGKFTYEPPPEVKWSS